MHIFHGHIFVFLLNENIRFDTVPLTNTTLRIIFADSALLCFMVTHTSNAWMQAVSRIFLTDINSCYVYEQQGKPIA